MKRKADEMMMEGAEKAKAKSKKGKAPPKPISTKKCQEGCDEEDCQGRHYQDDDFEEDEGVVLGEWYSCSSMRCRSLKSSSRITATPPWTVSSRAIELQISLSVERAPLQDAFCSAPQLHEGSGTTGSYRTC